MKKDSEGGFGMNGKMKKAVLLAGTLFVLIFGGTVSAKAAARQSGASTNSVTISWDAPNQGPSYTTFVNYEVYENDRTLVATTTKRSCTFRSAANTEHYYYIYEMWRDNQTGSLYRYSAGFASAGSRPVPVTRVRFDQGSDMKGFTAAWNRNRSTYTSYGYVVQLVNLKGKVLKQEDCRYYPNVYWSKYRVSQVCKFVIKPYYQLSSGTPRYYGRASWVMVVPQPVYNSGTRNPSGRRIKISWKKVSGATKYIVYVSTNPNKGYKKVATLGSSKSSYTLTKFRNKRIEYRKKYYFKVVTQSKYGRSHSDYYLRTVKYR